LIFHVIYASKNTSLKMATIVGRNMLQATLCIIKQIYISVYALVGRISHNDKPSFAPVPNSSIAGRICASDYTYFKKKMKFTKTVAAVTIHGIEVMVRTAIMRKPEWHSPHSD
jgi:ammonia channel protein AmtB